MSYERDDTYNESSQEYINPELRAYLRQKEEERKNTDQDSNKSGGGK